MTNHDLVTFLLIIFVSKIHNLFFDDNEKSNLYAHWAWLYDKFFSKLCTKLSKAD
jgi:hypothetical protein